MNLFHRQSLVLASILAIALTTPSALAQPTPPVPPTSQQAAPATPAITPPPAAPDSATLQAQGRQALDFILQREVLDPAALVPDTGQPLPQTGAWSVGKLRPDSCPPLAGLTPDPCVRVLYRVPGTKVSCEWVVLLQPGGTSGRILEQNPDSLRYMLRNILPAEAPALVLSRATPPPSRIPGTIEVQLIVSPTGEPSRAAIVSGPAPLRPLALSTARQWVFKPLTVGSRAIPFQIHIRFLFGGNTVKTVP